jgi:hypothetical protein
MLEDVVKDSGGDNGAGLKRTIYFALIADVLTWPTFGASATYADLATFTTAFAMVSTKRFWSFVADVRRNSLESISAGERGSLSSINKLEIVRAKFNASVAGFLRQHKNDDMVFICEDLNGQLRVLGSNDLPAELVNFTIPSGAEVSDDKNTKITVEAVGEIAPHYGTIAVPLAIPLTPAV